MTALTFDDEPPEDPTSRNNSGDEDEEVDLADDLGPGAGVDTLEDNSDSDEEGEDVADYEQDGFVVDADEEEMESNALMESEEYSRTKKKKRKKRKQDFKLDDNDLELLEENVEEFSRPKHSHKRRFFKRGEEAEPEAPENAYQLQTHLFGDDYEVLEDEIGDEQHDGYADQDPIDDDIVDRDEMGDFIVRDGREADGQQYRGYGISGGQNDRAIQEAASIFGDYEQLIDIFESAQQNTEKGLLRGSDADEDIDVDDPAASSFAKSKLDPEELKLHGLLPEDDEVRKKDTPERFQQRFGPEPKVMDYKRASEWIYTNVFSESSPMRLEKFLIRMGKREVDGPNEHEIYKFKLSEAPASGHRVLCEPYEEGQSSGASELQECILNVLEHIFKKYEEVPYIGTYCKHICGDLLCLPRDGTPSVTSAEEFNRHIKDGLQWFPPGAIQAKDEVLRDWLLLWAVYEWGLKWRRFANRIEKRAEVYEKAIDDVTDAVSQTKVQWCIDNVQLAESVEDVDDIDQMFELILSVSDCPRTRGGKRKSSKMANFCRYKSLGLFDIVGHLGLKHRLLNTDEGPSCNEEVDASFADYMRNFTRPVELESVEHVHHAAKHMVAIELACTPNVRKIMRSIYKKHAVVSTLPTDSGEETLDPFHPFGKAKRLRDKPIATFDDSDLFLRIVGAANDGLITYTFGVNQETFQSQVLKEVTSDLFENLDDKVIDIDWLSFREEIATELAKTHLFPSLAREFKHQLSDAARDFVKQKMSKSLWSYASKSPFKATTSGEDGEEETVDSTIICACCWGPGQPSTVLVMLDSFGQLVDVLHVRQFSGEVPRPNWGETEPMDIFDDERKAQDAAQVRDFLMEHKPHVIAVGATNLACRQLLADMKSIRDHFLSDHARFMVSIQGNMEVVFAQESVAVLWENSDAAKAELPDHLGIVRRAVALGRTLIDPLAVLAALRDNNDTILSLHLYDMQRMLNRDEKLNVIDQVMTTAVCQMGGELNVMANVSWRAPSLQFVAGLGPRKAQGLLMALQKNGNRVESRWELVSMGVLGRRVAKNATGFLRIRSGGLKGVDTLDFDMLDDTRIHPEHYELAKRMAMSVTGEVNEELALKVISMRPRQLEAFDLNDFNSQLLLEGDEFQLSILIDIQMELLLPFHDRREGYQIPKDTDVFYWLANQTPQVLKLGYLTEATVKRVDQDEVICILNDSKLDGVIKRENVSGSSDAYMDLKSRVRPGMVVHARITQIDFKTFSVQLTSRSKDLLNMRTWEDCYYAADKSVQAYYHYITDKEMQELKNSKSKKATRAFIPRPIRHPLFKNITVHQAIKDLIPAPVGDCILRPSSKGCNFIGLTIKLFESKHADHGVVVEQRDLHEGNKGHGKGSHLKLGLPITMKVTSNISMTFDDLDEVIACFVEPYVEKVGEVLAHRKFEIGDSEEVKQILETEKQRSGLNQAVYRIAADYKMSGWFYIGSILSSSFNQERFSVVPDGFYYRRSVYKSIEAILQVFKKKPSAPVEQKPNPGLPHTGNQNYARHGGPPQYNQPGAARTPTLGNSFQPGWYSAPPTHGFNTAPRPQAAAQGSTWSQAYSRPSAMNNSSQIHSSSFNRQAPRPSGRQWGSSAQASAPNAGWSTPGNRGGNSNAGNWKARDGMGWGSTPTKPPQASWMATETSKATGNSWNQAGKTPPDSGWAARPTQDNNDAKWSSTWESKDETPGNNTGWNSGGPKPMDTNWASTGSQQQDANWTSGSVAKPSSNWTSVENKVNAWSSERPGPMIHNQRGFAPGNNGQKLGGSWGGEGGPAQEGGAHFGERNANADASKKGAIRTSPQAPQKDSDSDSGMRFGGDVPHHPPLPSSIETVPSWEASRPPPPPPPQPPKQDSSSDSGMKF